MREYWWLCEYCHTIGVSHLRADEELFTVIDAIVVGHHYLSETCSQWTQHIQVINTPRIESLQDLEMALPCWAVNDVAKILGYKK